MAELEEQLTAAANRLEEFKVEKQSELSILHQTRVAQEEKRRALFEQVSHDNADTSALQQLNAVEEVIARIKEELAQLRRDGDFELQVMRKQISEQRKKRKTSSGKTWCASAKKSNICAVNASPKPSSCWESSRSNSRSWTPPS